MRDGEQSTDYLGIVNRENRLGSSKKLLREVMYLGEEKNGGQNRARGEAQGELPAASAMADHLAKMEEKRCFDRR